MIINIVLLALGLWGFQTSDVLNIHPVSEGTVNSVYKAELTNGRTRYVRFSKTQSFEDSQLESINRLADLYNSIGINASKFILNKYGRYIERITQNNETYYCTLLNEVKGRRLLDNWDTIIPSAKLIGSALGKAHKQTRQFKFQEGEFPSWRELFPKPANNAQINAVRTIVLSKLNAINSDQVGIIHGDLHASNMLLGGKSLGIIDFDDTQLNFFAYDIAVTIIDTWLDSVVRRLEFDNERFEQDLITAYTQEHSVSSDFLETLKLMKAQRALQLYAWSDPLTADNLKDATSKRRKQEFAKMVLYELGFLATYPEKISVDRIHDYITSRNNADEHFDSTGLSEDVDTQFRDFLSRNHIASLKNSGAVIEDRSHVLSRSLALYYKDNPIITDMGALQYMIDHKGIVYTDLLNNVAGIGHAHGKFTQNLSQQLSRINTNVRFVSEKLANYGQTLIDKTPMPNNSRVMFVNSGSEANGLALRIARSAGATHFITLNHAYLGNTKELIEISPVKYNGKGGFSRKDHVLEISEPRHFSGKYNHTNLPGHTSNQLDDLYLGELKEALETVRNQNGRALLISEVILGVGGFVPLSTYYLQNAAALVKEYDGILMLDEVQTGFMRTGTLFASQEHNIQPDILTLGKPCGNGYPIAAVIYSDELDKSFSNGMEYFNTYGGSNLAVAAGTAVLDILEEEDMQTHVQEVSQYFLSRLTQLQDKYPNIIGEIRGKGLFIGVEMADSKNSALAHTDLARFLRAELKNRYYILIGTEGPRDNVLKIKPPLPFTKKNVDEIWSAIDTLIPEFIKQTNSAEMPLQAV